MKDVETDLRGHKMRIRIHKEYAHLNIRKYSLVDTWNKLPTSAVNAPTINCFKSEVDAFLSTQVNMYSYRPNRC